MVFASREDAGRKLGAWLRDTGVEGSVIAGLPRGGVIVAAEAAHLLHRPLDVIVVRKVGHPHHREFAVGALAENGVLFLDRTVIEAAGILRSELESVIVEETETLREYQLRFHSNGKHDLAGHVVIIVDDGLATGATTRAAVASARSQGAQRVIVAAPVASVEAFERLGGLADDVIALFVDPGFDAVGRYYREFPQTDDDEVVGLLEASRREWRAASQ